MGQGVHENNENWATTKFDDFTVDNKKLIFILIYNDTNPVKIWCHIFKPGYTCTCIYHFIFKYVMSESWLMTVLSKWFLYKLYEDCTLVLIKYHEYFTTEHLNIKKENI